MHKRQRKPGSTFVYDPSAYETVPKMDDLKQYLIGIDPDESWGPSARQHDKPLPDKGALTSAASKFELLMIVIVLTLTVILSGIISYWLIHNA